MKILIVEDEPEIRNLMIELLQMHNFEVIAAENGSKGLNAFNSLQPDMIITDIQMPVMNGIKMVEKVREKSANIPIIVVSAHNEKEYEQKLHLYNVNHIFYKPINISSLIEVIKTY